MPHATPRVDGRFVIYIGLYGNRGDNPHAPLPVPRNHGAPAGNKNNPAGCPKGKTWKWKKSKCKECNKGGNRYAGRPLNSGQLHGECVAVFEKKQKSKKGNGGFAPIWVPDALRNPQVQARRPRQTTTTRIPAAVVGAAAHRASRWAPSLRRPVFPPALLRQ